MAELTTTNVGNTFNSGAQFHLTKAAKTNMTQAELDAMLRFISLTTTVVGVGDDTAGGFNAGASDAVHIITEGGVAPAAESNFGVGSTGITTTVVSLFNNLNQG
jgi:hypothetical protein|tara:strand:+ start:125 stop:436 length:312 start_codon:yes stop_codon:yes gene_type:complete